MKRLVIVVISISVFFCNTEAQLIMDCDGNVGIDESSPVSTLAIGGPGASNYKVNSVGTIGAYHCGLRGENPTSSGNSNYGVVGGIIYGQNSGKAFGVYGVGWKGSTPTDGRSYGVYGYAGNATNGYNYGAYGYLVSGRDGAAVYGTLSGDTDVDGQYAGYFNGDVHIEGDLTVDGTYPSSDIKLKKDVRVIEEDVISKLESLQIIRFKKKHYSEYEELSDTTDRMIIEAELQSERFTKDRIGLIAQELQLTFPEVVKETNSGYLAVDYNQLIPVLVKAITEQQVQIEELQAAIESGEALKGAAVNSSSSDPLSSDAGASALYQNAPNPFTEETSISFSLSETVESATLFIYNMSGKQLKSYSLHDSGDSKIRINGGELDAGMYMYSLVADGDLIGTKQMILTD